MFMMDSAADNDSIEDANNASSKFSLKIGHVPNCASIMERR
jgi:hypothetical protein